MPYATRADVEALMAQFKISASTNPSATQVESIIQGVSDLVESYLGGAGLTVPITTPLYFVGWVKQLIVYESAAQVLKSMFPGTVGAGENPAWAFWHSLYTEGIKLILNGSIIPDVLTSTNKIRPSTYFTRNSEEYYLGGIGEPFFKRSMPW